VERRLRENGYRISGGKLLAPVPGGKDEIRALHKGAVKTLVDRARPALERLEDAFVRRLRPGLSLDLANIDPCLIPIISKSSFDAALFRWAALHWSVPVSAGYGRRIRYLVVDRGNDDALMGIIGLGDPIFALRPRDQWIGWSSDQRKRALVNVMEAYALGAVPPYTSIKGGKLVALLASADEVRHKFNEKYAHRTTLIDGRDPQAQLVLITTSSALGRSSVYNRIRYRDDAVGYKSLGYTAGTGDFHLSEDLYPMLLQFASQNRKGMATHRHARWGGCGFRNKRETIQRALEGLGFDPDSMRVHGIKREIFGVPLAENCLEVLRGEDPNPSFFSRPTSDIAQWWFDRWGGREIPDTGMRFLPETWRLWDSPELGRHSRANGGSAS